MVSVGHLQHTERIRPLVTWYQEKDGSRRQQLSNVTLEVMQCLLLYRHGKLRVCYFHFLVSHLSFLWLGFVVLRLCKAYSTACFLFGRFVHESLINRTEALGIDTFCNGMLLNRAYCVHADDCKCRISRSNKHHGVLRLHDIWYCRYTLYTRTRQTLFWMELMEFIRWGNHWKHQSSGTSWFRWA